MEDDHEQGSIRRWMKYTGFSFQSLLTRQILSAISGLLVNLLITNFRPSSLKRALLLGLVSMLLAFVFRYFLIKLKSLNWWYSSPDGGIHMDTAGYSDEINPTSQQVSSDYSVFTSFRFPVPDNLLPGPERLPVAEDTDAAQVDSKRESAPVSIRSESSRLSSSLSQPRHQPPPPPPSYQPQWVTSTPTASSWHQRFLPSAPSSPMKGKRKLRTSGPTTRLKNMIPKASLLHQSLLHSLNASQASKPLEPRFRIPEADSVTPQKKGLLKNTSHSRDGNTASWTASASASSSNAGSWAWDFMEKASFDQFKRDYANFRSINGSLLGASATDRLRAEASRWNKRRGESEANERQKAQVSLPKEDHHQLQNPAAAPGPPAYLQAVTSEVNPGLMKMVERKTKCSGCLKTCMPSFCFQRRKREQRRWNSRRFRQISHAPLLWSPIHPPTTTTITSPPTGRCL